MNQLKIMFRDQVIFDGEVIEFAWHDTEETVNISGKRRVDKPAASGGGLLDLLTSARRQQTQGVVSQKRADLEAEKSHDDTDGEAT